MTVRPVFLDAGDALELGELLALLRCWLDCVGDGVAGSFGRFVGDGYDVGGLRADLSRFAFLLGSDDGELLLGGAAMNGRAAEADSGCRAQPMVLRVVLTGDGHRLDGDDPVTAVANRYLAHLGSRGFSPATVRAYAFDVLNFSRFLSERGIALGDVVPTDLFDYLDWQAKPRRDRGAKVVRLGDQRGAAPATMNRRIAAVRGLFEYAVIVGERGDNPVPAARRSTGLRPKARGLLGHIGPRRAPTGGRLVRQPRRLPESLEPGEVAAFIADLDTHRDRAMALAMLLGGLRASEVRSLRLVDVDRGMRRVRVIGKGNKERTVPIDRAFFTELGNYLRIERPAGCTTAKCFVVLRGPTRGRPLTEAGMRRIFRTHRVSSGSIRVRPHRLRHTYGTELATAGIDLLVLRELMGHASPETTAAYVHLSSDTLATEFAKARAASR